jgi:hypothetical protein
METMPQKFMFYRQISEATAIKQVIPTPIHPFMINFPVALSRLRLVSKPRPLFFGE